MDPRLVADQTTENRDRRTDYPSSGLGHPYSGHRMRFLFTMSEIRGRRRTTEDRYPRRRHLGLPYAGRAARRVQAKLIKMHRKDFRQAANNKRRRPCPHEGSSVLGPPIVRSPNRGTRRNRTGDLVLIRPRACQRPPWPMVELDGIEPTTSCLQSTRSPKLSYSPGTAISDP
jgi:hypothetical protein